MKQHFCTLTILLVSLAVSQAQKLRADIPKIIMPAELRQHLYGGSPITKGHRQKFGNHPNQHIDFPAITHAAKGKGIPPFLSLYFTGNLDTRAQAQLLALALRDVKIPVTTYGKRDTNHSRLNSGLGEPDDPATMKLYGSLDPLMGGNG